MKWTHLLRATTAGALLGCSGSSSPSQPEDVGNAGSTVAVRNNVFDPTPLNVPVNGTVTWVWNSGGVAHNIAFENGPSSGSQSSGSFSQTFPSAGTFPYICTIHVAEGMTGVVNVTTGTGGGGGGAGGGGGGGSGGGGGGGYGP